MKCIKYIKHSQNKKLHLTDFEETIQTNKLSNKQINRLRISAVAAYYNLFDVIKYLHEHGKPISNRCVPLSTVKGDIEIVKYLVKNASNEIGEETIHGSMSKTLNTSFYEKTMLVEPIQHRHEELIEYFRCNQYNYILRAMDIASEKGYLDIVTFLHVNGYKCSEYAMNMASNNGHLDIVMFLHVNGYKCTKYAMDRAAENGHFEIVKFLAENRTEGCTDDALYCAAYRGHIDILKYLRTRYPTIDFLIEEDGWVGEYKPDMVEYLMQNDLIGTYVNILNVLRTPDPEVTKVVRNNIVDYIDRYEKRVIIESSVRQSTQEPPNIYSSDSSDE